MWKMYKYRLKANNLIYDVKVFIGNNTFKYKALMDTGNTVKNKDTIIIFAEKKTGIDKVIKTLKPFSVSVRTISSNSVFMGVKPEKVEVFINKKYRRLSNVGIVFLEENKFMNKEYNMILNNNIFENKLGGIAL